jgi:hypothetical protein
MAYSVAFTDGKGYCPDRWFKTIHFEAKINFVLSSATELANVSLSSDKMAAMPLASFTGSISGTTLSVPGSVTGTIIANHLLTCGSCTPGTRVVSGSGTTWTVDTSQTVGSTTMTLQYNGGETMHADLIPAWDYGTGDSPGFMATFFQHCDGVSMHLKNSDGVTYTDLAGDPHECAYGRVGPNTQAVNDIASPDSSSPNPVVKLSPDMTGKNRYFPIASGTALPGSVLHGHN